MKPRPGFAVLLLSGALLAGYAAEQNPPASPAPRAEARPTFGPYEAIVMDKTVLQNVKVDPADGAIYLMFVPEKRGANVRIKISMAEGAEYRKWFTGEEELVALENGQRQPNAWTDQVKTTANYIEYRGDGKLFLHLKKTKQ
jgi:hypothetical protein